MIKYKKYFIFTLVYLTLTILVFELINLILSDKNLEPQMVTELIVTPFSYPHPYKLNSVAQYRFVHQIGEFLVRRDNYQNIVGGLAQSWVISESRTSIVFHLKPKIYTAEEVAQSLRRLISAKQTSHSNLGQQIESSDKIKVIDPLTLEIFTIGDAGAILAPLVMADTVIVPDNHWVELPGLDGLHVDWTKSKGPYVHESGSLFKIQSEPVIFKPNPAHYFYSPDLLKWKLFYKPIGEIRDLTELETILKKEPTFTTIRFWELLKIFDKTSSTLNYYETRPNGVNFLIPNLKSKVFNSKNARITLFNRLNKAKLDILIKNNRADQIPQPGLSGRLPVDEFDQLINQLGSTPDVTFSEPIKWLLPIGPEVNSNWLKNLAQSIAIPYTFVEGGGLSISKHLHDNAHDIAITSIGMSDTDPISGASFLFSPTALGQDLPDGRILKILNSAKETTDREEITKAVRLAFKTALEEALIIPINYVTNRHYFSKGVELNIQDPYSESIRIWEVRLKN